MTELLKRFFCYNGKLKFKAEVDRDIVPDYQHEYVVDEYRRLIENRKVLDGGCWTGPLEKSILLKQIKTCVVGFDENVDAISVARQQLPGFDFLNGNLLNPQGSLLPQYKHYFDTVIFLDVIEHLPVSSEVEVLRLFNTLLAPGGSLILSTMASHPFNFIDPAWFSGHRHYSAKDILDLLNVSGFEIVELKKIGNLFWDIDLLFFYFYKHVLRKRYRRPSFVLDRIKAGFHPQRVATRFYVVAQKKS